MRRELVKHGRHLTPRSGLFHHWYLWVLGQVEHQCAYCGKLFSDANFLAAHTQEFHSDTQVSDSKFARKLEILYLPEDPELSKCDEFSQNVLICPVCLQKFESEGTYQEHVLTGHHKHEVFNFGLHHGHKESASHPTKLAHQQLVPDPGQRFCQNNDRSHAHYPRFRSPWHSHQCSHFQGVMRLYFPSSEFIEEERSPEPNSAHSLSCDPSMFFQVQAAINATSMSSAAAFMGDECELDNGILGGRIMLDDGVDTDRASHSDQVSQHSAWNPESAISGFYQGAIH